MGVLEVMQFSKIPLEARAHKCVTAVSFNNNGYILASSTADGVRIWDLNKLKCARYIEEPKNVCISRFDLTGGYLAIGSVTVSLHSGYSMARELKDLELT